MDLTEDALRELAGARRRELVRSWRKKRKDAEGSGMEGAPPQDGRGDSRERTVLLPDTEALDAHRPPGA